VVVVVVVVVVGAWVVVVVVVGACVVVVALQKGRGTGQRSPRGQTCFLNGNKELLGTYPAATFPLEDALYAAFVVVVVLTVVEELEEELDEEVVDELGACVVVVLDDVVDVAACGVVVVA
jgi:hypothetical protein